jgi:hypothetical protein
MLEHRFFNKLLRARCAAVNFMLADKSVQNCGVRFMPKISLILRQCGKSSRSYPAY